MKLLTLGPNDIYQFTAAKEGAEEFKLGPKDLLVSIEVIY